MQNAKKDTQALREVKYAYTKEKDFSLEVNRAILKAFWISELRELNVLGCWKPSENFSYMLYSWANGRNSYF